MDYHRDLEMAVKTLIRGGVIIYPTDTIWGIGCDATNSKAVERIYQIKKRPESKSMIILIESFDKLKKYVDRVPEIALTLTTKYKGPLTIVYPSVKNVAKNVLAEDGSCAIRVTSDPFCIELCRKLDKPIVSSSANISGQNYPITFDNIDKSLLKQADYVVEHGRNEIRQFKPSTVIKLLNDFEYTIIRH